MQNRNMGMILEGLNESRINEAKQAIHVVVFSWREDKVAEYVTNSRGYNKMKKFPEYKEIDHYQLPENDSPGRFYNTIKDKIKEYGLDGENSDDGMIVGKYGQLGYGYRVFKSSKIKPTGYGFNK